MRHVGQGVKWRENPCAALI